MRQVAVILCVLSTVFGFTPPIYAKTEKLKAVVLAQVPTTSTYNWFISGASSTSCSVSSCFSTYTPEQDGTAQVNGATIYLQLPDKRIVVAKCDMKVSIGKTLAIGMLAGMGGSTTSNVYRSCRIPTTNSTVDAELTNNSVKIYMQDQKFPTQHEKIIHETYTVRGILQPSDLAASVAVEQSQATQSTEQAAVDPSITDEIAKYGITMRNGTDMDRCSQAKRVVAAYLQSKDETNYITWKTVEKKDCTAAGLSE
jgi:hypothetical protein